MNSKFVIQFAVVLAIVMMLVPQFATAATTEGKTTIVDAKSEHDTEYDTVVNVANVSSIKNIDTWDPVPQGIWIGGTTEESLIKMDTIMPNNSFGIVTAEFMMSATQIMSGCSEFVVRLPISMDTDISEWSYELFQIDSSDSYSVYEYTTFIVTPSEPRLAFTDQAILMDNALTSASIGGYPASSPYYDGDNFWTQGDRGYVAIHASILPDVRYLLVFYLKYNLDGRMKIYLSPNDVCSDKIFKSTISTYIPILGGVTKHTQKLNIDMGISFDIRQGESNGVSSKEYILSPGSQVQMWAYAKLDGTNNYHTVMIPFLAENHTASFSISVNTWTTGTIWSSPAQTFYNYVADSSSGLINTTGGPLDDYVMVILTSTWTQKVGFIYYNNYKFDGTDKGTVAYSGPAYTGAISNRTCQSIYFAYQLATTACVQPTDVDVNNPWPYNAKEYTLELNFDTLAIEWINLLTTGPIGIIIDVVAGVSVGRLLYPYLKDFVNGAIGFIRNAIDAAWNILKAIGEFLWSIGEAIFNALTWLIDQIIEYGTILLAILTLAVVMLITFFAIWGQLKIWSMGVSLAKGDVKSAVKTGQEVADVAGKVGGKIL